MIKNLEIVLFSGGRGSAEIAKALAKRPDVTLTLVVNAYDDGLSTGLVRGKFPGMLGPSDIRKNFSHILEIQGQEGQRLARLLEYRIGSDQDELDDENQNLVANLREFVDQRTQRISRRASADLARWLDIALDHLELNQSEKNVHCLSDMAIGNLVLAGAFVEAKSDFNDAIELWTDSFDLHKAKILNVTDGQNLVLVGTKSDGTYFGDESSIVNKQSEATIEELYLLKDYLSVEEEHYLQSLPPSEAAAFLSSRNITPSINPMVKKAIDDCQLIVYGPGTQHSSLFPSYMTHGVADTIAHRHDIEKIFIGNISVDYDIQSETITTLLSKMTRYMNMGSNIQLPTTDFVSRCFLSTSTDSTSPWGFEMIRTSGQEIRTHIGQWTSDGIKHDGGRVSNGLVSFARNVSHAASDSRYETISIVIPVLNEVSRLPIVLEKLIVFDWLAHNLVPEFIVVDGGSSDGSNLILESFPIARLIQLPHGTGRGQAIRRGVEESQSTYVVTFPSDDEYDVGAIAEVAALLRTSYAPIVFGSRIGLCADTDKRLRSIYGGRTKTYYLSKWGGFTLSVLSGVMYKRWISDTLTSVKGFQKGIVDSLSLTGKSADWDVQVIIDASKSELAIAEVPVNFRPRGIDEGKKIKPKDGMMAIVALLKGIFYSK